MFCLNDKCYCNRSNENYCKDKELEVCKNVLCNRHTFEIINPNNFPVCFSDFGEHCKDYITEIIPNPCPLCNSTDLKIYSRVVGTSVTPTGKQIGTYTFKIKCKCGLKYDGIKISNLEKNNKKDIELGKVAVILKWNKQYEKDGSK